MTKGTAQYEVGGKAARRDSGIIISLNFQITQNHSVSLRLPAQHKAHPTGAFSREPIFEKGRLKKEHLPQDHSRAEMLF